VASPSWTDLGVEISLPFAGQWLVENSPARQVPSHGSDLFGERYAIDFMHVDERKRTAAVRDWRTAFSSEPPDRFYAFGRPILSPGKGTIVAVHDGEPDHAARRSPLALVPYALSQASRVREGVAAVAGNHVIVALEASGTFVALTHLRQGSVCVAVGQDVDDGQPIGRCGNTGNSTQPHVHVQVMDRADPTVAEGVPMTFRHFREWPSGTTEPQTRERGMPGEGAVVEPLPVPPTTPES
jgi:hypothetical protein